MRVTNRTAFSLLEALGETENVDDAAIAPQSRQQEAEPPRLPPRAGRAPAPPRPPQQHPSKPPDVSSRISLEDKRYTNMCDMFLTKGRCSRALCYYAHSEEQLRAARQNLYRRTAEERAKLGWLPPSAAQRYVAATHDDASASGSGSRGGRLHDPGSGASASSSGAAATAAGYGAAPLGKPRTFKTNLCWHFVNHNGNCRFGDACGYAHGERELRQYLLDEAAVQAELAHKGLRPMFGPPPPLAPQHQQQHFSYSGAAAAQHQQQHPQQQQQYWAGSGSGSHGHLPLPPPPAVAAAADVGAVPMTGAQLAEYMDVAARLDDGVEVPEPFICPITQVVMEDPVVAADGFSYERHAIEAWLSARGTSPMSNELLQDRRLIPNHTLVAAMRVALGDPVCAGRRQQ